MIQSGNFLRFIGLFILTFIISGCHYLKINKPVESYLPSNYTPNYSVINIPVETSPGELEKFINRQFNGLIYSDTSFDDHDRDNLMLKAWTLDSIRLTFDKNQVLYRIPLKIWVRKKYAVESLGLDLGMTKELTAEIALKFRTKLSLKNDWTVSTLTSIDGYEWLKIPQIDFGVFQMPVTYLADLIVKSNQDLITKEIDKAFKDNLDIRKIMREIWTGMQKPILLSKDYSLWLKMIPGEISTIPLQGSSVFINHQVGFKTLIELSFGDEPDYTINENLPPLKFTTFIPEDFKISFSVKIPFTYINDLVVKQLIGYNLSYKKYNLIIRDIYFFGHGEKLVAAILVGGSIQGTIYLTGVPDVDKETLMLHLIDLDYEVNTKNVLIKSASWIFHSGFAQMLASKLIYPLGDKLTEARKEIRSYLSQNQTIGSFKISGTLNNFDLDKIIISPDAVKTYFLFEGKVKVKLASGY